MAVKLKDVATTREPDDDDDTYVVGPCKRAFQKMIGSIKAIKDMDDAQQFSVFQGSIGAPSLALIKKEQIDYLNSEIVQ